MLGLPFTVLPSDADESVPADWNPDRIVRELALRKAGAVVPLAERQESVIVGSDTIVVLDGTVMGKPADRGDSRYMLSALQGRSHLVYTGVACIRPEDGKSVVGHRMTEVKMRTLSDQEIDAYIETGEPADKAGSYAIQGLGSTLVEKIDGCYFNVVGLPLELLAGMFREFGIRLLDAK